MRRKKRIRARHGVAGGSHLESYAARTHAEIGAALGLTGARVQQIEKAALRKLRLALDVEERDSHLLLDGRRNWRRA